VATVKVAKGRSILEIDDAKLADAADLGYQPVTDAEVKRTQAVTDAATIGGGVQGGAEALARGASLGFSDSLLRSAGVDAEGMAARSEGLGSQALEVAGAIAPALLSGGSSTVGTAARFTLAGRTAQVGRAITGATEAAAGKGLVSRVAGAGLAGGFEGAVGGMGAAASEAALGDRDLAAEQLLAGAKRGAGLGALFGAGTTTLGIGLDHAYRGTRRVAGSAVERALGAGDDAASAAGRASLMGDSVIERAAARQIQLLGGTADDVTAASRYLSRTRTPEGRALLELGERGGSAIDDAVGARLRSSVGRTSTRGHVDSWSKGLSGSGGKVVQKQAAEAHSALDAALKRWHGGNVSPGAAKVRSLLRAESSRVQSFDGVAEARDKLTAAIDDARAQGDVALPEIEEATRGYLDSAADPALWGQGVEAAAPLRAAQRAERDALAALPSKARKALEAGELDDDAARALAREPDALAKVLDARAAQADALEKVGIDVADLRKGMDEVRGALKYRGEVAGAADDAGRLRALEEGPGATARGVIKMGSRAAGTVLGGLSFGGAALGEMVGEVLGAATKPASVLRTIARARGGIDAVRARQAGAVQAFARLADGAAEGATRATRGAATAARRVPPAVAKQQQRDRRREALDTLARVSRMASDPREVAKEMGPAVVQLRAAAPSVAGQVIAGAARAAAYLRAVAPPIHKPTGAGKVAMVDPFELDAWARKADAVADPPAALDRAATGKLTKGEAAALAAVYPRMWADFQREIMVEVGSRSRDGKPLSFAARNALGTIGGVAADDSLRPADFAAIQASMSPPPPHPAAPPPRSQIKPTAPNLPKWQELEAKA
jgi:hypothetical protein